VKAVHISDGVLPPLIWIGGYAVAGLSAGAVLRRLDERRIPQVAVMSSVFFVASSIPLPVPRLHLLLNGLVGVVLGWDAIPAIFLALLLQFLLLGHGGLTSLGVNTVTMGAGAIAGHYAFRLRRIFGQPADRRRKATVDTVFACLAGAVGVIASGALYFAVNLSADPDYRASSEVLLAAHLPLLVIEPAVTASAVAFLCKVKPELIGGLAVRR